MKVAYDEFANTFSKFDMNIGISEACGQLWCFKNFYLGLYTI